MASHRITLIDADLNNDGDDDIVLGAFTSMAIPADSSFSHTNPFANYSSPIMLLRNVGKRDKKMS